MQDDLFAAPRLTQAFAGTRRPGRHARPVVAPISDVTEPGSWSGPAGSVDMGSVLTTLGTGIEVEEAPAVIAAPVGPTTALPSRRHARVAS